jgi:hypothetical protein
MAELSLGDCRLALEPEFLHHTSSFIGPLEERALPMAGGRRPITFRPNVVVMRAADSVAPSELSTWVESQLSGLASMPGFKQLGREPAKCADGTPAVLQHHAFENDGVLVEQLQLYAVFGQATVVATATHLAGEPFAAWRQRFTQMLRTLRGP